MRNSNAITTDNYQIWKKSHNMNYTAKNLL